MVNTAERRLYLVQGDGQALRYGIGVGRDGLTWAGTTQVSREARMAGLDAAGADAARGTRAAGPHGRRRGQSARRARDVSRRTLYRIHGSNEPETIGQAVSSGCFRMTNEDVMDLYNRVRVGATVIVQR